MQPAYVERQLPSGDGVVIAPAIERSLRAAFGNTWYPCKNCQPSLFFRWAGDHLNPLHNAKACDVCCAELGRRSPTMGGQRGRRVDVTTTNDEPAAPPAHAYEPPMRTRADF